MLRKADLDDVAATLFRVRYQLLFGEQVLRAERDARKALSRLERLGAWRNPHLSELELVAEATLSVGRALRLQGRQIQAAAWLRRAANLFAQIVSWGGGRSGATALAETLNLLTVLKLNVWQAQSRNRKRPPYTLTPQTALLASGLRVQNRADHELDLVQRKSELLLMWGNPAAAHRLLLLTEFRSIAAERPEHSRALRLLFAARAATAVGRLDESHEHLDRVAALAVVRDSPFVKVMFIEGQARQLSASGSVDDACALLQQARLLRLRERINEQAGHSAVLK